MFSAATTALVALLAAATLVQARPTECGPSDFGLWEPTPNQTITQYNNLSCTDFKVFYCSGQYYKTRSISIDVLLSSGDVTNGGQILVKDAEPNNGAAGYYGYSLNATICPSSGNYLTGPYVLSIFESETGVFIRTLLPSL